jgi:sec-independent protein translocase protein TatB
VFEEPDRVPGSQELLVIAVIALLVLGPERLPDLARSAARALAKLRTYTAKASSELRGVADLGDIEREVMELRRELGRTRAELRRTMRETISPQPAPAPRPASSPALPWTAVPETMEVTDTASADLEPGLGPDRPDRPDLGPDLGPDRDRDVVSGEDDDVDDGRMGAS